ncbi:MAG: L-lactate dehydrogenase [Oscillospiraceae bacterium]|nr:L-lactate dehydrogenase [Oscillospiraceae bacterium]
MRKISIIGAGNVGATIANDLMIQSIAEEIVLVDINHKKATGEALDVYQGAPFQSPCVVRPGACRDVQCSDIVIITCGIARKPGMTRLDLAQTNVDIIRDVAKQVVPYAMDAIYIIVSNPVDILTYYFIKASGLPEHQVIGSGTILDTSRLQSALAKRFLVSPKNVHAHVYGEHGDSSFVPWSLANIANAHVDTYAEISPDRNAIDWDGDYEALEQYVKKSGGMIIENKGATFFAVSMSVCHICKCIYSDAGTSLTVSTMMHGEYGVDDVCLSVLTLVDRNGIRGKIVTPLTEEEVKKLHSSADKLKSVMAEIN